MEDCVIEREAISGLKLSELLRTLGCEMLSLTAEISGFEDMRREPLFALKMSYVGVLGSGLEECGEEVELLPYRMDVNLSQLEHIDNGRLKFSDAYVSVVFVEGDIPKIRWEKAVGDGFCLTSYGMETPRGNYLRSLPNYTCNLIKVFYF